MGFTIDELSLGQKCMLSKTITETDVYLFAGISCDANPIHVNMEYAKKSKFKDRIVHGILSASLISAVIGTQLPGTGTIYVSQTLNFLAPVYFGDTITAIVEVKEVLKDKNRVILKTSCINQNDVVVLDGEAIVIPPKKQNN